ncbi:MAG: metallophosphoesterase [Candidatus Dormibacteraeota bacterium]|nr:metallophosphoesterase [Candidatus Dormibacteraeota bacterium]
MRLLHLADLHLDRAFGGMAFTGCDGSRRRALLRRALEWAVDTAEAGKADAVTIGGDLFELEHITSDTLAFITRQLGRLSCPVIIASGNHDPSSAASPYRVAAWPANVILCLDARPTTVDLKDALVVGLGYTGKDMDRAVLERIPARGAESRPRLLLVHGVDLDATGDEFQWGGLTLRHGDLDRIGIDHALLGHVHAGQVGARSSWPGSPVPLDPGETRGLHGAAWVEVTGGIVTAAPVAAELARFETISVEVTELSDSTELTTAVGAALEPLQGTPSLVVCRLFGRRSKSLEIKPDALAAACCDGVLGLTVADVTDAELDLLELAREPTARGAALRHLLEDGTAPALLAARLVAEAFAGELEVPA